MQSFQNGLWNEWVMLLLSIKIAFGGHDGGFGQILRQ